MVEPINTETRVMEGVRFSPNFVAGWNSCLFAIRSNPLEKISHKEAARMIEEAANSITTKEAAIDLLTRVGIIEAPDDNGEALITLQRAGFGHIKSDEILPGFQRTDLEEVLRDLRTTTIYLGDSCLKASLESAANFIQAALGK